VAKDPMVVTAADVFEGADRGVLVGDNPGGDPLWRR
jgi:hypothetical protein